MAMTSHMVCEKNSVQQIEYPFAQSLNKAILPVLVSGDPLDLKRLKDAFPQLPPVYEMNRAALYPPLSSLMGKIEDLDAKRLYCLGLAYLNGIDVEINYEKGVRMIERAAQRDELRAIRKLIAIYEEGLGLPSNLPEAIFWTKRLAALDPCEEAFQKCAELSFKNRQFDQAKEYILDALHILHREKNALHHGQKAMPRSYERQKTDWISLEAALLNLLGDIDLEKDDLEQAEANYKRALQMNYDLVYDLPARPALQSLSHSLLHMGNLYRKLNRSSSAAKCFQRAIEICARMAKDIDMPEILSDLMMALEGMAQVSLHENRRAEARTYARQAVQIAWQTIRRLENGETLSQLTRVVLLQEELFEQDHDWLEAQVCSEEALQASEKGILLARTQRTLTARLNALLSTSRLFKVQGMGKEGEQIGWQATQTARELELVEDRSEAWSQLLKCLRELAEISLIQAKSSQAREYAKEGLKLARKLNRTDASLLSVQYSIFFLSLLGTIPVRCEEISYSVRCCKEAIQLIQDKMPNPEGELLSLLGLLEEQTGNLYRSDSQPEKAADHFQNAYKIQERLLGQKSFQEDLRLLDDLVFLLDSMAGQKHQVNPSEPYVPSDRRRLSEDTSSRQALCAKAMARLQDKLVEIYQGGKNNMEQTIEARQKAFEARKQAARLEPNQSSLHDLAFSANELRRFYTSRHDFEQALYYGEVCAAAAGELVKLCNDCENLNFYSQILGVLAAYYDKLNRVESMRKAMELEYKAENEIADRFPDSESLTRLIRIASQLRSHYEDQEWLKQASDYGMKAVETARTLVQLAPSDTPLLYLAAVLSDLGNLRKKQNMLEEAQDLYQESLLLHLRRYEASSSPETCNSVLISIQILADLNEKQNHLNAAESYCKQGYETARKCIKQSENPETLSWASTFLNSLARISAAKKDKDAACQYMEQAVEIDQRNVAVKETLPSLQTLAANLENLSLIYAAQRHFIRSRNVDKQLSQIQTRIKKLEKSSS